MSWNGTVRCSVCYKSGHNKSGCPQVAKDYEEYKDLIAKYNAAHPDKPDIEIDQYLGYGMRQQLGLSYRHMQAKDIIETEKLTEEGRGRVDFYINKMKINLD